MSDEDGADDSVTLACDVVSDGDAMSDRPNAVASTVDDTASAPDTPKTSGPPLATAKPRGMLNAMGLGLGAVGGASWSVDLFKHMGMGASFVTGHRTVAESLKHMGMGPTFVSEHRRVAESLKHMGPGASFVSEHRRVAESLKHMGMGASFVTGARTVGESVNHMGMGASFVTGPSGAAGSFMHMSLGATASMPARLTAAFPAVPDSLRFASPASSLATIVSRQLKMLGIAGGFAYGAFAATAPTGRRDYASAAALSFVSQSPRAASAVSMISTVAHQVETVASVVDEVAESRAQSPSRESEADALDQDFRDDVDGRLRTLEAMAEPVYQDYARRELAAHDSPLLAWAKSPPSIFDVLGWLAVFTQAGYQPTVIVVAIGFLLRLIARLGSR